MSRATPVVIVMLLIGCRSSNGHPSASSSSASIAAPIPAFVRPQILIEVDEARLSSFGLTLQDVQAALLAQHLAVTPNVPGSFVVATTSSPADVLAIAIKFHDGVAIRLSDVARASMRADPRNLAP